MNNDELYKRFAVSSEYIEASAAEYESTDWKGMKFGGIVQGRPRLSSEPLTTLTAKVPDELYYNSTPASEEISYDKNNH